MLHCDNLHLLDDLMPEEMRETMRTRHKEREMGWIQTHTGRKVDPLNMQARDVSIEDIAHSLAQINRYTGHAPWPYSVAQHSILVAQHCAGDKTEKLWALLHDAPEAYLADIARPVKEGLPMAEPEAVKRADTLLLVTEGYVFFGNTKTYADWQHQPKNGYLMIEPPILTNWPWHFAKNMFIEAFEYLKLKP